MPEYGDPLVVYPTRVDRKPRGPAAPPPPLPRRLDAGPLLALVDEVVRLDGRSRGEVIRGYGLEDREYFRFKEAGTVSFDVADRWVCRLGVAFGRIYPEYWEVAS